MLKAHTITIICALGVALAACGGDGKSDESKSGDAKATATATATPTSTAKPTATKTPIPEDDVKGLSVFKVGQARDTIVSLCVRRRKSSKLRKSKAATKKLEDSTQTLVRAFRNNPDEKWKRTPGVPAFSMRTRLESTGLFMQTMCAGGRARTLGRRMSRLAKQKD